MHSKPTNKTTQVSRNRKIVFTGTWPIELAENQDNEEGDLRRDLIPVLSPAADC
jgi:hypothetical protein